jgi:glycosyltransferase involved in cell wall biosynthesis
MRIGFVTGEYPPMQGGVGAYTRELAAALVQQGHQTFVFTDKKAQGSSEPGIEVSASVKDWNWGSLVQTRRWAQANRLDIVNIQYQTVAFQMAPFVHLLPSRLNGVPTVTTFHDLLVPYLFPKAGPLRYQAILTLARTSDAVIVTNRQDEQRLSVEKGIQRLRHVPIGSNIPDRLPSNYDVNEWRARFEIPPDAIAVGYFGFLNASKGIETLLRGVAMAAKHGANIYLLMIGGRVGSSDPTNALYAQEVDILIEYLDIGSRVKWTGFVHEGEVSGHLHALDLLILPYQDGVSFRRGTFMAGLVHGCAIVTTTPAVELPEIQDGVNVRLIPPESANALSAAIQGLANNPALRKQLQTNARKLSQLFNWDSIAEKTAVLFQEITEASVASL